MIRDYDASEVFIVWGGVTINEFFEDSVVQIGRSNSSFKDMIGCDGEVARLKTKDFRGTITFSLAQTSPANLALSSASISDELIGKAVSPIIVKDNNGNSLYSALESWISKPADSGYNREGDVRVWIIRCRYLLMFSGGH